MFNVFKNKKEDKNPIHINIYKEYFDIIYNDGKIEKFTGESTCSPSLYSQIDNGLMKIYSYKLPCNIDKVYYRNIQDIDHIQYY